MNLSKQSVDKELLYEPNAKDNSSLSTLRSDKFIVFLMNINQLIMIKLKMDVIGK